MDFLLSVSYSFSLAGSGDVRELRGVDDVPSRPEAACDGDVGCDGACDACLDC